MAKFIEIPDPVEESITLVAGTAKPVNVKAPREPGLVGVRYEYISHDRTALAGGNVNDVGVQVIPKNQSEIFGGDTRHYFLTLPQVNTTTPNAIKLGFTLASGEDVRLNFLSATGGVFRYRLQRVKIFEAA